MGLADFGEWNWRNDPDQNRASPAIASATGSRTPCRVETEIGCPRLRTTPSIVCQSEMHAHPLEVTTGALRIAPVTQRSHPCLFEGLVDRTTTFADRHPKLADRVSVAAVFDAVVASDLTGRFNGRIRTSGDP